MSSWAILTIYLILLAGELAWEQLLLALNLRYARACARRPPREALEVLPEPEYLRALEYEQARGRLGLVSNAAGTAFLLAIVLSGVLGSLHALLGRLPLAPLLRGILFVYAVSVAFALLSLPFSIYAQFRIEERFGFNRMSVRLFLMDMLKSLTLSIVLMTPLLYLLFRLIRAGGLWWLWAFAAYGGFQFLMLLLYPRLIAPLFNRFTPLPDGPVKEKIEELASLLRIRTRGIFLMDGSRRSKHSNAYLSGLGRAKRIVLFDTLVASLTPAQAAAVLAHEIGHERKGHLILRLALSLGASLTGFWLFDRLLGYAPLFRAFGFAASSPEAALALLAFFSGPLTALLRPFASWASRRQEHAADRFAGSTAGCGASFIEALIVLGRQNLANPLPHPWYSFYHYSHPTIVERIRALRGV